MEKKKTPFTCSKDAPIRIQTRGERESAPSGATSVENGLYTTANRKKGKGELLSRTNLGLGGKAQ